MMEIPKQERAAAIASIKRYFQENMPEPIGDLAAGLLLNYFLEELGPLIYNKAIVDAQPRMQQSETILMENSMRMPFSIGRN
jgi:uncharacterized protein (DUF2164 family)